MLYQFGGVLSVHAIAVNGIEADADVSQQKKSIYRFQVVNEYEERVVREWAGLQCHSKTPYLAELRGKTSTWLFIFLNAMRTLDISLRTQNILFLC